LREFNIAQKVNSFFREAEVSRGEFTKTRAKAEVAGNCLRAIPLTFLAYAEQREADPIRDRVFSLLQQRCAFGGVGEEPEGLECEQVEIMSDSAAFGSRSPRVFIRFTRPIILCRLTAFWGERGIYAMEGSFLWRKMNSN
jgi:hypothetical protein